MPFSGFNARADYNYREFVFAFTRELRVVFDAFLVVADRFNRSRQLWSW